MSFAQDVVIRESDQIRRDYEARMHSKIKATVAEERERAQNAIVKVAENTEVEKRELQNGLQQAVARNYRIRQSHENKVNELLEVMDEERAQCANRISQAEEQCGAMQDLLSQVRTEKAELQNMVSNLKQQSASLESQVNQANMQVEAERRQAADNLARMQQQHSNQFAAAVEQEVQRRVAQVEAELKAKAERAVKQDERSVQDRIAAEVKKAKGQYEAKVQNIQWKASKLEGALEAELSATKANYEEMLASSEASVKQLSQVNAELSAQLQMLNNTEDERIQQVKNSQSTSMFELAAARKAAERAELQRDETEKKLETVIKESDTMRRVFEAALNEADSVASMLKEQLDIVRGSSHEQALASDAEIKKQKAVLEAQKAETSALEMAKFQSEAELRDELQALQMTAEQLQMSKEQLAGSLRTKMDEGSRSKVALGASIKEADILSKELEAADERCESIQREAEVRVAVLQAEKARAVEEYKAASAADKALANEAKESRALAEKKLRQAEMALSRSKYELGTALQQTQKMRLEQEEAEVVLDLLDGTLGDVRDSHAELVYEADDIISASKEELSASMRLM